MKKDLIPDCESYSFIYNSLGHLRALEDYTHEQPRRHPHEEDILKLHNVTGIFTGTKVTGGVNTVKIAIVVTVAEKKDVAAKSRVPDVINGIPTDVIEETIVPMIGSAVRLEEIVPFIDTTNYPTLEGGMSIGPCRSIHLEPPDAPAPGTRQLCLRWNARLHCQSQHYR